MIGRLARLVVGSRRRAALTVVVWALLAVAIPSLAPKLADVEDNRSTNDPPAAAESMVARDLLRARFPDQRGVPALVVVRDARGLTPADLERVATITAALSGPHRPDRVAGATSVANQPQARSSLVSADRTTTVVVVPVLGSASDDAFGEAVDGIRRIAGRGSGELTIRVTGPAGIIRDTVKAFGSANLVLLFGTLVLVLVLLLVIYRAPLMAVVPLVAVGIAIEVTNGVGAALVSAGAFDVNSQAASIMTVLLFGVGTDYCLFVISRYREELAEQPDRPAAMRAAVRQVAEALVSSAGTVVLGLLILLLATLPALRGFGPFLALSVAVMLGVGLTFVPACVVLLGGSAFWPRRLQAGRGDSRTETLWSRAATLVLARPGRTTVAATVLLAILSAGLIGYKESYNFLTGFRVATDSEQGQDLLNAAFPPGELAPTTVLVDGRGRPLARHLDDVEAVTGAVAGVSGVRSVTGPTRPTGAVPADPAGAANGAGRAFLSPDGTVARLSVVYSDDPYRSPALDRTLRLRTAAREALRAGGLSGGRVLVGGESAVNADLRAASRRDLEVIVPLTLLVIALVLGLLLRSLVAPLYLIATTVASLFAAVGVTVFVLVTLLGDEGMGNRVTAYIFVFLVALGVDYTIYLMSRVRQEIRQHGPDRGLHRALARSGGVISSAGVILAGTFAVLMTQPIRELFQFGFAMTFGILLDTFVVRAMLVPAVVKLLGPRAWWPGHRAPPPAGAAAGDEPRDERRDKHRIGAR